MSILLTAPAGFATERVAEELRRHDIAAAAVALDASARAAQQGSPSELVLVAYELGVMAIGEALTRVQAAAGGLRLTVCSPRLTPDDQKILADCGAGDIVTPGGWTAEAVADRVLGDFVRRGLVQPDRFGALRGATCQMRELYREIETVAPLEDHVLIVGETGTGKELVASEIHARSHQRGPLVSVNCAALNAELVASDLFGHEKGAFTGATSARKGLMDEAGKGTIFLDEIGDLAPDAQAKLLRVLEDRKVRPVGSDREHSFQARVLLATNKDLERAVADGAFRADLFQRISGFTLHLPPLRERLADLPILAQHFLDEFNRKDAGRRAILPEALDHLFRHDWPGNVRELDKVVRNAAAHTAGPQGAITSLSLQDIGRRGWRRASDGSAKHAVAFDPVHDTWRAVQERLRAAYFSAVLEAAGGDKTEAARRAGVGRTKFYEELRGREGETEARGERDPSTT